MDHDRIPRCTRWESMGTFISCHIKPGFLPIIEPQDTPTPLVTSTIDPTLAAQFIVTAIPSRLPTFTPPSPLEIPTLIPEDYPKQYCKSSDGNDHYFPGSIGCIWSSFKRNPGKVKKSQESEFFLTIYSITHKIPIIIKTGNKPTPRQSTPDIAAADP